MWNVSHELKREKIKCAIEIWVSTCPPFVELQLHRQTNKAIARPAPVHPSVIHRQGRAWWAGHNLLQRISSAVHCGAHYRVRGARSCIAECSSICDSVLVTQAERCDNRGDKERHTRAGWILTRVQKIYNSHVGCPRVSSGSAFFNEFLAEFPTWIFSRRICFRLNIYF